MASAGYQAYQKLCGAGVNGTGSLQEANAAIDQLKQTYADLETRVQGLNYQLSGAWEGAAADAALLAATPFVKTLQNLQDNLALHHVGTNDQTGQFGHSAGQMIPIPPDPPSNNFLNVATPWTTDLDRQISDYSNADTHNVNVLNDYQNTTHNNVTKLPSDYQQLTTDSMPNVQATAPQSTPGGKPMGAVPHPGAPGGGGGGPAGSGGAPPGVPGSTSSQSYHGAPSVPGGSYGGNGSDPLAANSGYGADAGYGGMGGFAPLGGATGSGGYGGGKSFGGYGGGASGGGSGNAPARGAVSGVSEGNPAGAAAGQASAARSSSMPGGMGGAMGGARGRGGEDTEHKSAGYLVDEDNGHAIIGDLPKTVPPVIGG